MWAHKDMSSSLLAIATGVPRHRSSQEHVARFASRVIEATASGARRDGLLSFIDRIYSSSGICHRSSVVADFATQDPERFEFFPRSWDLEPFPTTAQRMARYEVESIELATSVGRQALEDAAISASEVTHVIVCTCTGFFAPGIDVLLIDRLGLERSVSRTVLGFMGCYAGLSGLRVANSIVGSDPKAVVLQVCVELCSLHFQKRPIADLLIANSIFSDGCAAAVYANSEYRGGIANVFASQSLVEREALDQMSWRIGDHGFEMRLAASVPKRLRAGALSFVERLLVASGVDTTEVRGWAFHPGGRKILDEICTALSVDRDAAAASYGVLSDFGNMSSASILFVLERLLRERSPGEISVALSFGPGLTIEGAVLQRAGS